MNSTYAETDRVLLLQGPVGHFFSRLHATLEARGHRAWRVSFHAGDSFFSNASPRLIQFRGGMAEWKDWLTAFIRNEGITKIVLFGSGRPVHRIAREVADLEKVVVLALEEGYIRPGFITAEIGGNNADSPIAGQFPPNSWHKRETPATENHVSGFAAMCRYGALYYLLRTIFTHGRRKTLFHRTLSPVSEPFFWLRNYVRSKTSRVPDLRALSHLLEHHDRAYYIIPLQVSSDGQLQEAALGWDNTRLITEAIESFGRYAPEGTRLVFKVHPLERGHCHYTRQIQQCADKIGVGHRVVTLKTGPLSQLVQHSAGMITINSTSGLSAIHHGVPLMVIGQAIYTNSTLADCAMGTPNFARFWQTPYPVATAEVRHRYLHWLREQALCKGDFYHPRGVDVACHQIVTKLERTIVPAINIKQKISPEKKTSTGASCNTYLPSLAVQSLR